MTRFNKLAHSASLCLPATGADQSVQLAAFSFVFRCRRQGGVRFAVCFEPVLEFFVLAENEKQGFVDDVLLRTADELGVMPDEFDRGEVKLVACRLPFGHMFLVNERHIDASLLKFSTIVDVPHTSRR